MMHNDGCTLDVCFACRRRLDREIARYLEAAQRIILYKSVVDKEVRSIDNTALLLPGLYNMVNMVFNSGLWIQVSFYINF